MAQEIADKIRAAATAKGIDPDVALRIAGVESGYNAGIKNPRSSAKGLFQITDDTWKRYGGKPGMQRNADENIRVGMNILADSSAHLTKDLGHAPRPSELYTAHFFGWEKAADVIQSDPKALVSSLVSKKVMAANPELKGMTVADLMSKHETKFAGLAASAKKDSAPAYGGVTRENDVQKMMTNALQSGMTSEAKPSVLDDPRIKALGTNYQTALAATALANSPDDEDDDGTTEAERFQNYMAEQQASAEPEMGTARRSLAAMDLTFKSPFAEEEVAPQEPVHMAIGGTPVKATANIRPTQKKALDNANSQWATYKGNVDKYNSDVDVYNNAAKKVQTESQAWMDQYNAAQQNDVFGVKTRRFLEANPQPTFDMTAPAQPGAAPTVQPKTIADAANRDVFNRNTALTAASDPDKYNLSMPRLFAEGGEVDHMTPQAIEQLAQREQAGRDYTQNLKEAPFRASTYTGLGKGLMENIVPNTVGIPVDLTNMVMGFFGYKNKKPILGSEWNKEFLTEYGMRPEPPAEGTNERNFYDVGNFASFFVNPASGVRKAITAAPALAEKGVQALQAGKEMAQTAKMGAQLGAESVASTAKAAKGKAAAMLAAVKSKNQEGTVQHLGSQGYNRFRDLGAEREAARMEQQERNAIEEAMHQNRNNGNPQGWTHVEPGPEQRWFPAFPDFATEVQEIRATHAAARAEENALPRPAEPTALPPPTEPVAPPMQAQAPAEPLPAPPAEVNVPGELLAQEGEVVPRPAAAMPEVTPVAPPMQAGPTAERPFVGRLDTFVEGLKGPVPLGQFKAQLRGKFRDYDLERVERAFAGMDEKTKVTPAQIKQALAGTHSPATWISETIQPENSARSRFYRSMDNPWDAPLGTTNLYLEVAPEKLGKAQLIKDAVQNLGPLTTASNRAPKLEDLENARNLLARPELAKQVDPALITELNIKFNSTENAIADITKKYDELDNLRSGFLYPILYKDAAAAQGAHGDQPFFRFSKEAENALMEQRRVEYEAADLYGKKVIDKEIREQSAKMAAKKVHELAAQKAVSLGLPVPDLSLINWGMDTSNLGVNGSASVGRNTPEFSRDVAIFLDEAHNTIAFEGQAIKQELSPLVNQIANSLERVKIYEGKHPTVTLNKPQPISFTRFSEHEANIPGMGRVQGRYFHELQSDLASDMRERGSTHGSKVKDEAEYQKLEESRLQLRNEKFPDTGEFTDPEELRKAEEKWKIAQESKEEKMKKRMMIIKDRHTSTSGKSPDYSLEEPFAGFETNAELRRQLMIKNAIQSSMRDGKSFATFPGKESAKWKLYIDEKTGRHKVEPSLNQVVKDLGGSKAGFKVQYIKLPNDTNGNPVTALGVTWNPETAAKIVKEGVPFAKGGMVERQSADNRRYL